MIILHMRQHSFGSFFRAVTLCLAVCLVTSVNADDPEVYWCADPQITATWLFPPPDGQEVQLRPGESLTLQWECSDPDRDHYYYDNDPCVLIPDYEPSIGLWSLLSDVGSQFDVETHRYTAGSTFPTGAYNGHDRFSMVVNDEPWPKNPDGGGTRDDSPVTIGRDKLLVYFPASIVKVSQSPPQQIGGTRAWQIVTKWRVQDQWGHALHDVGLTEAPVTICTNSPNHNWGYHLYGVTVTGEATSSSNPGPDLGTFTDTFRLTAPQPPGRAVTDRQTYGVSFGTYSDPGLKVYRAKIINSRPNNQLVVDESPPPWSDAQINCMTNY